jgi:predicted dehydrogenase
MTRSLAFGCIGVGGYAGELITMLDRYVHADRARLAAVDVSMSSPGGRVADVLSRHGTAQVGGVEALLEYDGLDVVMIATSIDSHLPYTRAALARGLHVHCEKPITATVEDAQAMIALRDAAKRIVHVGYQDTYSPAMQWAKGKLLDGAIGRVRQVKVQALWPRPDRYYARNDWAGRITRRGRWVLDSPAHNALAHQINLALYLTGPSPDESNAPVAVEAELYRAREIENYDTCAMRAATRGGCDLLVLLTHAASRQRGPVHAYLGERGTLHRDADNACRIVRDGRVVDRHEPDGEYGRPQMFANLLDHVHRRVGRSICEIENAIEPVRLVNGASQAAPVIRVDARHVDRVAAGDQPTDQVCAIRDIDRVFDRCFAEFALPGEIGASWAAPGGKLDLRGYQRFAGVPAES